MAKIDESLPFIPVNIAVLTVSDTRSRKEDKSGQTLERLLTGDGHTLADRTIVKDDIEQIRKIVQGWIDDKEVDVVITTGGTGFTGRDVTPEAIRPLFEKEIEMAVPKARAASSMKANPIQLDDDELSRILEQAL